MGGVHARITQGSGRFVISIAHLRNASRIDQEVETLDDWLAASLVALCDVEFLDLAIDGGA
jgi:hypothetical protein